MPTQEQLDNMINRLGYGPWSGLPMDKRVTIMALTIAAMQAKALADIAYLYGFASTK